MLVSMTLIARLNLSVAFYCTSYWIFMLLQFYKLNLELIHFHISSPHGILRPESVNELVVNILSYYV